MTRPEVVQREDCMECGDTRQVEEAVYKRMSNEERAMRLLEVAIGHTPLGDPERGNDQPCIECGHPWPCFTFVAATGLGDG